MIESQSGMLALLFTNIAGSTRAWQRNPAAMAIAVTRHDAIVRKAIEAHHGYVFKTIGDAFCATFATVPDALAAGLAAQRELLNEPWHETGPLLVQMAVHVGDTEERDGDYSRSAISQAGRLLVSAAGGQILLSQLAEQFVRDVLPAGTALRDLGLRRLEDFDQSEHIFQVVSADLPFDFPPLLSLDRYPNNLPPQPTPFVGRERDVATIVGLLQEDRVRLLTVTGPSGVGKSRLALQASADLLSHFEDGVFFVDLESVRSPDLMAVAIVQALGVDLESVRNPNLMAVAIGLGLGVAHESSRSFEEIVTHYLSTRRVLLVLIHLTHLIPAAPALAQLLAACPGVKLLTTSRQPLRLDGEHEYRLAPLPLPSSERLSSAEDLAGNEAVALFVQRAQAVAPAFRLTEENAADVVALCRRLDGLPLAIELAAARVNVLPPAALLRELEVGASLPTSEPREAPERQQTMRNAIRWSYDLLTADEQALFRLLAVFVGGFTLDAADELCRAAGARDLAVPDVIASLVDRSLVQPRDEADGEPLLVMLDTIRAFGLEQLSANQEQSTAWRAAQSIRNGRWRAGALEGVAAILPTEQQVVVLQEALRSAREWTPPSTISTASSAASHGEPTPEQGTPASRMPVRRSESPPEPVTVFIAYSHRDERLRDNLVSHLSLLERQHLIEPWYDRKIMPGDEWEAEIDVKLETAKIVLLLVSATFLASNFCYEIEMARALERHRAGDARVIPIILRPVDWKGAPFAHLQVVPRDAKPVTRWSDQNAAWVDVIHGVRRRVEELTASVDS